MAEHARRRVAAIQWGRQAGQSAQEAFTDLHALLRQAAEGGAELIALAPGVDRLLAGDSDTAQLRERFEALAASWARECGAVLAPGSLLLPQGSGWVRTAYLFGANGGILGVQTQTHRTAAERAQGVQMGGTLAPIATPLGAVGLVTGVDVSYPEVSRILCLQGATLLVHQAALATFSEPMALSRLWREVQANQVFGVEAYAVGEGCRGRSAIHCPVEMAPGRTGWLARAADDAQPAVVSAVLHEDARQRTRAGFPIAELRNPCQYERYFPGIYDVARPEGEHGHA